MRKQVGAGVVLGALGLMIDGLAGVLIYPILITQVGSALTGIWVLTVALSSLLSLIYICTGPVISRIIANTISIGGESKLSEVVGRIVRLYTFVFGFIIVASFAIYYVYLRKVYISSGFGGYGLILWGTAVSAQLVMSRAYLRLFILNGMGVVGRDKLAKLISVICGTGVAVLVLYRTKSLLLFAACSLLQALILYAISKRYEIRIPVRLKSADECGGLIVRDSGMIALLNIVAYLLNNVGIFYSEKYYGLEVVVQVSGVVKIGMLLATVSLLFPQMSYPFIAQAWASGDYVRVRKLVKLGVLVAVLLYGAAALVFASFSEVIIKMWLQPVDYIGAGFVIAVLTYYGIYTLHISFANPVIATGGSHFALVAMLNIVLVLVLMGYCIQKMGVIGIPLGMIAGTVIPSVYVISISIRRFYLAQNKEMLHVF